MCSSHGTDSSQYVDFLNEQSTHQNLSVMFITELNFSIVLPYGFFESSLLILQFLTVFLTCPKEPMRIAQRAEASLLQRQDERTGGV